MLLDFRHKQIVPFVSAKLSARIGRETRIAFIGWDPDPAENSPAILFFDQPGENPVQFYFSLPAKDSQGARNVYDLVEAVALDAYNRRFPQPKKSYDRVVEKNTTIETRLAKYVNERLVGEYEGLKIKVLFPVFRANTNLLYFSVETRDSDDQLLWVDNLIVANEPGKKDSFAEHVRQTVILALAKRHPELIEKIHSPKWDHKTTVLSCDGLEIFSYLVKESGYLPEVKWGILVYDEKRENLLWWKDGYKSLLDSISVLTDAFDKALKLWQKNPAKEAMALRQFGRPFNDGAGKIFAEAARDILVDWW